VPAPVDKHRGAIHQRAVAVNRPRPVITPSGKRARKLKRLANGKVRYLTADITKVDVQLLMNVRRIGVGRVLVIAGNGPSLNEVDLALLKDHERIDIMSINKPDQRVWPTRYWLFCDNSQLRRHRTVWENYNGTIFNSTGIKQRRPGTIFMKHLGGLGFSRDVCRGFHIGRSSVYAAMQVALWLDYDEIFIVGCDMCDVDGKTHFYGINPDVRPEDRIGRFAKEASHYANCAEILNADERKRYTFCSSYLNWPFVEKFNKMDHKLAAAHILERANQKKG